MDNDYDKDSDNEDYTMNDLSDRNLNEGYNKPEQPLNIIQ